MLTHSELKAGLQQYFGYDDFRARQKPLAHLIGAGESCLGILQTGGGKSVCFQLPALLSSGVTIVISPLISLITDQVRQLKASNLPAEAIIGETPYSERSKIIQRIRNSEIKLLYVSPELFCQSSFIRQFDETAPLCRVVFDEAHCLSQWGEDFRPGYLRAALALNHLSKVYQQYNLPTPQVVAVTASATPAVQKQIVNLLGIDEKNQVSESLSRENLALNVHKVTDDKDRKKRLLNLLNQHTDEAVIIYTNSRREVTTLCQFLLMNGLQAEQYHAGLDKFERHEAQRKFINDDFNIMVATTAFGMGIDKPNIRAVIHYKIPRTIEDYYQQVGRAGRDGQLSHGHLFFSSSSDFNSLNNMLAHGHPNSVEAKKCYEFLLYLQKAQPDLPVEQSFSVMAKALDISEPKLSWCIHFFERHQIITQEGDGFFVRELKKANWKAIDAIYNHRTSKASQTMGLARSQHCRQTYILTYFGENNPEPCGLCDNCRQDASKARRDKDDLTWDALKSDLRVARDSVSKQLRVPPVALLSESALAKIIKTPPATEDELRERLNMPTCKFQLFGRHFVEAFEKNGLSLTPGNGKSPGARLTDKALTSTVSDDELGEYPVL